MGHEARQADPTVSKGGASDQPYSAGRIPLLARRAQLLHGGATLGRTWVTEAVETTDDSPPPNGRRCAPLLARGRTSVDGDLAGRSINTRMGAETVDDPGDGRPRGRQRLAPYLAGRGAAVEGSAYGRTLATKASGETSDDPPD